MKIHLSILVIFLALGLSLWPLNYQISKAATQTYTISGLLSTTAPKDNPYQANYKLTTQTSGVYYLKLTKSFYKSWVNQVAYFVIVGDAGHFAIYSSGLGYRPTTLPKTGPALIGLALLSLMSAAIYQSCRLKKLLPVS